MVCEEQLSTPVRHPVGVLFKKRLYCLQRPRGRPSRQLDVLHYAVRPNRHQGAVRRHLLRHVVRVVPRVQQHQHRLGGGRCCLDLLQNLGVCGAALGKRHPLLPQLVLHRVVARDAAPCVARLPGGLVHVHREHPPARHLAQFQYGRPQQRGAAVGGARLYDQVGLQGEDDVLDGVHVKGVLHRDHSLPVLAREHGLPLVHDVKQQQQRVVLVVVGVKRLPLGHAHALRF
mmetsp:Transcript_9767/g.24333  ORF Transcript_9767/g.24333 Transcript_9767/m.24333 type:complete len:230 (+) Transcript_9767:225-914(+)